MRYTGCSQSKCIMKYFILTWLLSLLLSCMVANATYLIRTRPDGNEFWGDNYTVTEDGELTIPCDSQQIPNDSVVVAFYWQILQRHIGTRRFSQTALITKRIKGKAYTLKPFGVKPRLLPNTRTLNIKNITRYLNGTYRCLVVSMQVGKVKPKKYIEATYFGVEVKAPARIYSTMKTSIHLSAGDKLELDCTSSGNPPPKVTWRRIDGPKLTRTIQHNQGLLSVHDVGQTDRGKYKCIAFNSLGNDSTTFVVDVRVPARIITKEISYATVGKNGKVKCEAFGNPSPTFFWSWYEGHSQVSLNEVETTERFNVETVHNFESSLCYLKIKNVTRSDLREYVCNAKNFDYVSSVIQLKGYSVPERPIIRTAIPKVREISITWSYGDGGGKKIKSVIIEYALTNAVRWENVSIENYPLVTHYTIKNLRPHTWHKFRVYAVSEIGKSSASLMRFATTQLAIPTRLRSLKKFNRTEETREIAGGKEKYNKTGIPERPTIRIVVAKDTEISIGWSHGYDGGIKINSVIIEYMLKNTSSKWKSVWIENDPQVTQYTIKDLRPQTWYKFRVYAMNEIGKSSASAEKSCGTTSSGIVIGKTISAKRLNTKETIGAVTGGFLILVIATVIICISLRKIQRKNTKKAAKEAQRIPQSNKQNQDIKNGGLVHI